MISDKKTLINNLSGTDRVSVMHAFKSLCQQTPYAAVENFNITPEVNALLSGEVSIGLTAENVPQAGAIAWVASAMKQVMPNFAGMQIKVEPGAVLTKTTLTFQNREKLPEAINATYLKLGGRKKLLDFNTTGQSHTP